MSTLFQILLLTVPALLVLATAVWLLHLVTYRLAEQWSKPNPSVEINAKIAIQTANVLKTWLDNEAKRAAAAEATDNRKTILPLRLQACERLVLMLERINLTSVMMRAGNNAPTASHLELAMLQTIRDEFDHNITQQLFVGVETWQLVRAAREEAIALIKQAASGLTAESSATDLMVRLIEHQNQINVSSTDQALNALREEIRLLY